VLLNRPPEPFNALSRLEAAPFSNSYILETSSDGNGDGDAIHNLFLQELLADRHHPSPPCRSCQVTECEVWKIRVMSRWSGDGESGCEQVGDQFSA
jgi:hypothetical protein